MTAFRLFALALLTSISLLHAEESSRAGFLFALQTAVKTHDFPAMQQCFNLEGADFAMVDSIRKTLEEVRSWPSPHVFTSERGTGEPLVIQRDGKTYVLNGNWSFQVHIHKSPPPSRGFVFPAGLTPSGAYKILVTVPKS